MLAAAELFGVHMILWVAAVSVVTAIGRALRGRTKIGKILFGEDKPGE